MWDDTSVYNGRYAPDPDYGTGGYSPLYMEALRQRLAKAAPMFEHGATDVANSWAADEAKAGRQANINYGPWGDGMPPIPQDTRQLSQQLKAQYQPREAGMPAAFLGDGQTPNPAATQWYQQKGIRAPWDYEGPRPGDVSWQARDYGRPTDVDKLINQAVLPDTGWEEASPAVQPVVGPYGWSFKQNGQWGVAGAPTGQKPQGASSPNGTLSGANLRDKIMQSLLFWPSVPGRLGSLGAWLGAKTANANPSQWGQDIQDWYANTGTNRAEPDYPALRISDLAKKMPDIATWLYNYGYNGGKW